MSEQVHITSNDGTPVEKINFLVATDSSNTQSDTLSSVYVPAYNKTVKTDIKDSFSIEYLTARRALSVPRQNFFGMENLGMSRGELAYTVLQQTRGIVGGSWSLVQDARRFAQSTGTSAYNWGVSSLKQNIVKKEREVAIFKLNRDKNDNKKRYEKSEITEEEFKKNDGEINKKIEELKNNAWIKTEAIRLSFAKAEQESISAIEELRQRQKESLKNSGFDQDVDRDGFGYQLASGFGSLAAGVGASLFGGPYAGGVLFAMAQWQNNAEEAISAGASREKAHWLGLATALPGYVLETAGIEGFLRPVFNKGLINRAVGNILSEGSEEFTQNLEEDAVMVVAGVRNKTVQKILSDAVVAGIIGCITAAPFGVARAKYDIRKSKLKSELNKAVQETKEVTVPDVPQETKKITVPFLQLEIAADTTDKLINAGVSDIAARQMAEAAIIKANNIVAGVAPRLAINENIAKRLDEADDEQKRIFEETIAKAESVTLEKRLIQEQKDELDTVYKDSYAYARNNNFNDQQATLYAKVMRMRIGMYSRYTGLSPFTILKRNKVGLNNQRIAGETVIGQVKKDSPLVLTNTLAVDKNSLQDKNKPVDNNNEIDQQGSIPEGDEARGSIQGHLPDAPLGETFINLFKSADESTLPHELSHLFLLDMQNMIEVDIYGELKGLKEDLEAVLGKPDGGDNRYSVAQQEYFAEMYEKYLYDGLYPKGWRRIFVFFKNWLHRIYKTVDFRHEVTPKAKKLFDRWLSFDSASHLLTEQEIKGYNGNVNALKEVIDGIKDHRSVVVDGVGISDVKKILYATQMNRPAVLKADLIDILKKTGINYATSGLNAETLKKAGIPNNTNAKNLRDILADEGFIFIEDKSPESLVKARTEAEEVAKKALAGETVYRLSDMDNAENNRSYDGMLALVDRLTTNQEEVETILDNITDMEQKGIRNIVDNRPIVNEKVDTTHRITSGEFVDVNIPTPANPTREYIFRSRNSENIKEGGAFQQDNIFKADDYYPAYTGETIDIEGKERSVYNSTGERIAKSEVALRNFYKWFGDSKVVDEQGRPLVVYHGTNAEFDTFELDRGRKSMDILGSYFSTSETEAQGYAGTDGNVYKIYLKIENPADFDTSYKLYKSHNKENESGRLATNDLLKAGYDGVINEGEEFIVIKNPTQIKSVNNRGTYSSDTGNVYYQPGKKLLDKIFTKDEINYFDNKYAGLTKEELDDIKTDIKVISREIEEKRAEYYSGKAEEYADEEFDRMGKEIDNAKTIEEVAKIVDKNNGVDIYEFAEDEDVKIDTLSDIKNFAKERFLDNETWRNFKDSFKEKHRLNDIEIDKEFELSEKESFDKLYELQDKIENKFNARRGLIEEVAKRFGWEKRRISESHISDSVYFTLKKGDKTLKIRLSDHKDVSVNSPHDSDITLFYYDKPSINAEELAGVLINNDTGAGEQGKGIAVDNPRKAEDGWETLNQSAKHVSRSNFKQFNLAHVGEGEGVQVHGYGLYFAKDAKVIQNFVDKFSQDNSNIDVRTQVYTVDIPENYDLLDEQKTFNEQPKRIQKRLREAVDDLTDEQLGGVSREDFLRDITEVDADGGKIYAGFSNLLGSDKKASEYLHRHGIKGITYDGKIDGQCFVIFEPADIIIEETLWQGEKGNNDNYELVNRTDKSKYLTDEEVMAVEANAKRFKEYVGKSIDKTLSPRSQLIILDKLPSAYNNIKELKGKKLVISQEIYKKIIDLPNRYDKNHNVERKRAIMLPYLVADPNYIVKSNAEGHEDRFIVITNSGNGRPAERLSVILQPNTDVAVVSGYYEVVNISEEKKAGRVVYDKKKELSKTIVTSEATAIDNSYTKSIQTKNNDVNGKGEELLQQSEQSDSVDKATPKKEYKHARDHFAYGFRSTSKDPLARQKIDAVIDEIIDVINHSIMDPKIKEETLSTLRSAKGHKDYLTKIKKAQELVDKAVELVNNPPKQNKPEITPEKEKAVLDMWNDPKQQAEIEHKAGLDKNPTWSWVIAGLKDLGQSVTDRVGSISPRLKKAFREFTQKFNLTRSKHNLKLAPFIKAYSEMSEDDRHLFDYYALNNNQEKINKLANKYPHLANSLTGFRETMGEIYIKAAEVGFDIGFISDYFPRRVKNYEAFITYLKGTDEWTNIQRYVANKLNITDPDHWMTIPEHMETFAYWANQYMNTGGNGKGVMRPGNTKARKIFEITPEMTYFYYNTADAVMMYASEIDRAIAAREFFGYDKQNEDDTIGMLVMSMVEDRKAQHEDDPSVKLLTFEDEKELRTSVQAFLHPRGPNSVMQAIKDWGYMATLVSPISSITQLEDLAVSFVENEIGNTFKAMTGEKITLEDIGASVYDADINTSKGLQKALNRSLDKVYFSNFDRFSKETFILADYYKRVKQVKNDLQGFIADCVSYGYNEQEITEMINELRTEDTKQINQMKSLLFYDLAEVQPLDLAEMPVGYLRGGNWRIAYALKTFTLKRLNYLVQKTNKYISNGKALWAKGEKEKALLEWKKGIGDMTWTLFFLVLSGASMDWLKDFILGRQTDMPSVLADNVLKQMAFNRWEVKRIAREGPADIIVAKVYPPVLTMFEDILRDSQKIAKGKLDVKDMQIWQNVPILGRFYYWWFGGGKLITEKKKKKNKGYN